MKQLLVSLSILVFAFQLIAQGDRHLEPYIDSIFSRYENQPGCAIAVVKGGRAIFQKGYGLANLAYDIPIGTKTIFEVASVSKQLTAGCIFLLAEEGKLSLNDPIQKYLPEIPVYGNTSITIQNLIHHTSGLRSYLATLYAKNIYWGDSHDNNDVIKIIARHTDLNFPTGTKHYYSNSNYALLASIVERASGRSLAEYAKEKIFNPLDMSHTFFKDNRDTIVKGQAIGYESEDGRFRENHHYNTTVVGDGGLHTNLEDFIKWSNNLKTGLVGGRNFIKKMTAPGVLPNGDEIAYAGGLYYQNYYDLNGLPSVVHSGNWAGFRSLYYKFIDQDIAFIIFSNSANANVWVMLDQLVPLFLADDVKSAREAMNNNTTAETQLLSLSNSEKKKFCGKYYSPLNGYLREIKLEDDQLMYIRSGARPTPLVAISANELIYEAMPFVKLTFDQSNYQSMVVTINDANPMPYTKYQEHRYTNSELKQFENHFYNKDIDAIYQIVALENELQILVNDKEIVRMKPFAKDLFTSAHSGYLKFKNNVAGKITGFTQFDDQLYNISFEKIDIGQAGTESVQNSERKEIERVLVDYIEGTSNGKPDRVRNAFHEDLNLYSVKNDSLAVWNGQDYVAGIAPGKKNSRQGRILSIDYENNAATAKVEIVVPGWRIFTDYFLLLKIHGNWKIIHKSYTWRSISK